MATRMPEPDAAPAPLDDPPLPPVLAVLSVVLFAALGVLTAALEVVLVPLRAGTTILPLTVVLAALSNIVLPVLSRRAVDATAAAVAPFAAWIVTVVVLSQSRPEGDVLLPAISPLLAVTYALLAVGAVCGIATVVRLQRWAG